MSRVASNVPGLGVTGVVGVVNGCGGGLARSNRRFGPAPLGVTAPVAAAAGRRAPFAKAMPLVQSTVFDAPGAARKSRFPQSRPTCVTEDCPWFWHPLYTLVPPRASWTRCWYQSSAYRNATGRLAKSQFAGIGILAELGDVQPHLGQSIQCDPLRHGSVAQKTAGTRCAVDGNHECRRDRWPLPPEQSALPPR